MFDEMIENQKNDIIHSVCELIGFNSVSVETGNPDMPFGKACNNALDYTLNLARELGFQTKNLDGYCGYVEFGEGKEMLGIIGHLDVVPAQLEDGWKTNPFAADIRDNKIYGRGAIDDKGPVIASLYAMKAVLDSGVKLNKKVRLILGLNEEKSWKCIKHYQEIGEQTPTIGFSPDADFPCIYAEKGILSVRIKHPFSIKNMEILNIDCKENALNVVPKYCSITFKISCVESQIAFENTDKITIEKVNESTFKITSHGISAHAAHPDLGENAITNLIHYLNLHVNLDLEENEFAFLQKLEQIGVLDITSPPFLSSQTIQDESGILTSNIGFLGFENSVLEMGINLRVPIHTPLEQIKQKYEILTEIFPEVEVEFTTEQAPLYVPKQSYLVQTLTKIFQEKTGLDTNPIAIGGGTYARAFPNCVAFGANMPGQKDMCHQVDEFMDIHDLILSTKIYAQAIYELGTK